MTTLPNASAPAHVFATATAGSAAGAPSFARERTAQRAWARTTMRRRRQMFRCFRAELAAGARELAATIAETHPGSLHRSLADTLVAEVLPLAEACRFLEREAAFTLRTRRESTGTRPFWLGGVEVEVERAPFGVVLIIGPGNYPLFLPGVQALQALAAGNAVLWKPAPTGIACAHALRVMLIASGMPPDLLTILDAAPSAATAAIAAGVDKVVLTGSAATGERVLHDLAATATPAVLELSGCDAVFVLAGADLARVVDALVFGLRLNGSATCMAPRRVFVPEQLVDRLAGLLAARLNQFGPVSVPASTRELLAGLIAEASLDGARVLLDGLAAPRVSPETQVGSVSATLLSGVTPAMRIAQTDVFAPLLSLLPFHSPGEAAAMHERCPYALTAAIFGPEPQARLLATNITAGTILYNDIIVATADPRVPFGARKRSGFGVTRGREGLLAMTTPCAHVRQRSRSRMAYQPTTAAHAELFAGLLKATHARGWRQRLAGWRAMAAALPGLRPRRGQP